MQALLGVPLTENLYAVSVVTLSGEQPNHLAKFCILVLEGYAIWARKELCRFCFLCHWPEISMRQRCLDCEQLQIRGSALYTRFCFFFPKLCNSCKKEILQFLLVVSLRKILLRQIISTKCKHLHFMKTFPSALLTNHILPIVSCLLACVSLSRALPT